MRNAIQMVQAFGLAIAFLLFINGSIGWALIYALAGALALSAGCCILSRGNFSVEVTNLSGAVNNGAQAQIRIVAQKTGFCFVPYIVTYFEEQNLLIEMPLLFSNENSRVISLPMKKSGLCEMHPTNVWVCGFFGVLRLSAKGAAANKSTANIPVLPAFVPYEGEEIIPKALPSEDEDAEESVVTQTNGLLGCEHRPYISGDPLRNINYKLSAKRGELMVRLCESSGTAPTVVRIEPTGEAGCADMAFAIARELITHGGSVRVVHGEKSCQVSSPQTLERLREWLSLERFGAPEPQKSDMNTAQAADVVIDLDGQVRLCA